MGKTESFRAGVGIALIDARGRILALERGPKGSGQWQMAQGGVNRGEEPREALYREMKEELGLDPGDVEILREHPDWLAYELPEGPRSKKHGRGQVQKWFLVRLLRDDSALDLGQGPDAEFADRRWTTLARLADEVWQVRRPIYRRLTADFSEFLE